MPLVSEDYQKYVLDDLEKYDGLRRPVEASVRERLMVKKLSPLVLHPNPDDEFSQVQIGPNFEIVQNYVQQFKKNMSYGKPITEEPLMVEKMVPEGYQLLNGHHRWFAALRIRAKHVPVQIVNLVHEKDLRKMIAMAQNHKRAVFDLDEVLFVPEQEQHNVKTERAPALLRFDKVFHKRIRLYAPALLIELQKMGYDIWVYTAGYYSARSIYAYFKLYHVELSGIVNGIRRGRNVKHGEDSTIKKAMAKQYQETLHIDTNHVLRICQNIDDYDYITLDADGENWSSKVIKTVRGFQ